MILVDVVFGHQILEQTRFSRFCLVFCELVFFLFCVNSVFSVQVSDCASCKWSFYIFLITMAVLCKKGVEKLATLLVVHQSSAILTFFIVNLSVFKRPQKETPRIEKNTRNPWC